MRDDVSVVVLGVKEYNDSPTIYSHRVVWEEDTPTRASRVEVVYHTTSKDIALRLARVDTLGVLLPVTKQIARLGTVTASGPMSRVCVLRVSAEFPGRQSESFLASIVYREAGNSILVHLS